MNEKGLLPEVKGVSDEQPQEGQQVKAAAVVDVQASEQVNLPGENAVAQVAVVADAGARLASLEVCLAVWRGT